MRRTCIALAAVALLAGCATPPPAPGSAASKVVTMGQLDDIEVGQMRVARENGYLTVNGTRTLRPWELGLRLTLDAGFGLVPVRAFEWDSAQTPEQATRTQTVVDSVATGVIGISLGLASHLVVGAALPLQRVAGKAVVIPALYNDRAEREPGELSSFGLGELEISAKYSLLEVVPGGFITPGGRAGVSGVLRFGVPTGDTEQFRGEPGITLWPSVVTEYAPFPFLRGALEAGYRFVARTPGFPGDECWALRDEPRADTPPPTQCFERASQP